MLIEDIIYYNVSHYAAARNNQCMEIENAALIDSNHYNFGYDVDVIQPSHTMEFAVLHRILQSLAICYSIVYIKAGLDDIIEGLNTLMDVLSLAHANGSNMRTPFVKGAPNLPF